MKKGKVKIGIDLDGVIVDKPFFIPKKLIEWLFRAHHNHGKKYRIPKWPLEILIRKKSHHWLLRPPIRKNLETLKKVINQNLAAVYIISGRYRFLSNETKVWFKKNKLEDLLKSAYINKKNLQPHLFKEKMTKKLKLDYFFDDDPIVINHLKAKIKGLNCYLANKKKGIKIPKLTVKN